MKQSLCTCCQRITDQISTTFLGKTVFVTENLITTWEHECGLWNKGVSNLLIFSFKTIIRCELWCELRCECEYFITTQNIVWKLDHISHGSNYVRCSFFRRQKYGVRVRSPKDVQVRVRLMLEIRQNGVWSLSMKKW